MTVSSTTSRWSYTGNGTTGPFAYTTKIFEKTDLKVYVANVLKTVDTHYTVSGLLSESGGNVTFTSGNEPANGASVVIVKDVPNTQGTSLPLGGSLPSTAIESALDKLTILVQQIYKRATSRILRQPDSDATDIAELPVAASRADKLLGFDSSSNPVAVDQTGLFATTLTGEEGKIPVVNADEDGYEFQTALEFVTAQSAADKRSIRGQLGASPAGTVRLLKDSGGSWRLFTATGAEVDISASTSSGLQEAIDLACTDIGTRGYDLEILGDGQSTGGATHMDCGAATIEWPPMQGKNIRIGAVSFGFQAGIGSDPCFRFDSMMMVDFRCNGAQIVNPGTGFCVDFHPQNGVPLDDVIAVVDSHVEIMTQASSTGKGTRFFPRISANTFYFNEINTPGTNIEVTSPSDTDEAFDYNNVFALHCHEDTGGAVFVGTTSTANNVRVQGNRWMLGVFTNGSPSAAALTTYANGDTYFISGKANATKSFTDFVKLQTQATKNQIFIGSAENYSNLYTDSSSTNDNFVCGMGVLEGFPIGTNLAKTGRFTGVTVTSNTSPANGLDLASSGRLGLWASSTKVLEVASGNLRSNSQSPKLDSLTTGNFNLVLDNRSAGALNTITFQDNSVNKIQIQKDASDRLSLLVAATQAALFDTNQEVYFPNINTTASAANAFLDSGSSPANQLLRSTSSARYKRDIETVTQDYADKALLLRPVYYRSKCEHDNQAWGWYGLIAEEVAEVMPQLVHWARPIKKVEEEQVYKVPVVTGHKVELVDAIDEDGKPVKVRKLVEIIEYVDEVQTITRYEADMDQPLRPEAVQYERLTVLLLDIVRRQEARILALESRYPE